MKPRFPLYGQILLWFFLNLALVAVALYLVCTVIFGMDVRTVVHDAVERRAVAAGREVSASLREAPREKWDDIIAGYGKKYRVRFSLYHSDGRRMSAESPPLPENILSVLRNEHPKPPSRTIAGGPGGGAGHPRARGGERGPPGPRPPGRHRERGLREGEGAGDTDFSPLGTPRRGERDRELPREEDLPDARTPPRPRMLFYQRTGSPTEYWAGVWLPLYHSEHRHPFDGVLLAKSSRLQGNGIFVDWKPWLWPLLAVLGISALIWLPFVSGVTRRLRRLTSVAESISEGDFEVAAVSRRSDEIGRLSRAIRRMSQRLETFVTGQKRFLGDTAHELCSPLARIRMHLGLLEREIPDAQRERLGELEGEVEELSQLVNELLAFSKASLKPASLPLEDVDLRALVQDLVERETEGIEVHCELPPRLIVHTNREFARRAVSNVLRNAVRYAGGDGAITISCTLQDNGVDLHLTDQGPGIAEEWLDRVLEPFARPERARTREGGGVGLGLAITKSCLEAVGGRLRLQNSHPKGLMATLTFPSDVRSNEIKTA